MKKIISEWKSLRSEYGWKALLDSLFAGYLFASLLFVPLFIALGELISIFMYWKEGLFLVITLAIMGYFWVANGFVLKALVLKKPNPISNPKYLMRVHGFAWMGFALLAGLVFTFILLPIIWI